MVINESSGKSLKKAIAGPGKKGFKNTREAAKFVARIADERKADYVKVIDVGQRLIITDYFVLIVANNTRLTKRIAEEISQHLKKAGKHPLNIDGASEGNWILMDYDDFVVHIFTNEYKDYYDLERLWRDSKTIKIKTAESSGKQKTGKKKTDGSNDINIDIEIKDNER